MKRHARIRVGRALISIAASMGAALLASPLYADQISFGTHSFDIPSDVASVLQAAGQSGTLVPSIPQDSDISHESTIGETLEEQGVSSDHIPRGILADSIPAISPTGGVGTTTLAELLEDCATSTATSTPPEATTTPPVSGGSGGGGAGADGGGSGGAGAGTGSSGGGSGGGAGPVPQVLGASSAAPESAFAAQFTPGIPNTGLGGSADYTLAVLGLSMIVFALGLVRLIYIRNTSLFTALYTRLFTAFHQFRTFKREAS